MTSECSEAECDREHLLKDSPRGAKYSPQLNNSPRGAKYSPKITIEIVGRICPTYKKHKLKKYFFSFSRGPGPGADHGGDEEADREERDRPHHRPQALQHRQRLEDWTSRNLQI